jgi:ABC-type phosphate/phosphonate transport system ATPase subunit
MYRLEQLAKRFDTGVNALVGIDLAVQKGEQVALIGPSGAGKTTLFRLLNLTLPPTAGRLFFAGADTTG